MELFIFLIIILVIYFVATQIQVVHSSQIPAKERVNIRGKNKPNKNDSTKMNPDEDPKGSSYDYRKLFMSDPSVPSGANTYDYTKDYYDFYVDPAEPDHLPNTDDLFTLIRNEYVDSQFRFNIVNQPVTTRRFNRINADLDSKYTKQISKNINSWNDLFEKYFTIKKRPIKVVDIKPLVVMETTNEFVIKVNVAITYTKQPIYYLLTYFGQIDKTGDFFGDGIDIYTLQLVDIKQIKRCDYQTDARPMAEGDLKMESSHSPSDSWVPMFNGLKAHL